VVRTNIRHHGFNAQGEIAGVSGLHEDKAMSTQECARQIIYGMVRRRREVVMTAPGKLARYLKLLAPWLVEHMAQAAVKKEFQPKTP
jgi:short-subunit dehydrogenase